MDGTRDHAEAVRMVRARAGMFFGSTGPAGAAIAVAEPIGNVADLFLAGQATFCRVDRADTSDGVEWTIEDDGPGLPFDVPSDRTSLGERFLTTLHHGATGDGHAPHVHFSSFLGMGLSPVVAVCRRFELLSWRAGQRWRFTAREGVPTGPPAVVASGEGRGTTVRLVLDPLVFGESQPERASLRAKAFEMAHLLAGWDVGFCGERFLAPGGLAELLPLLAPNGDGSERVHVVWRDARLRVEVAACGRTRGDGLWRGWCNGVRTPEGSHVAAVRRVWEERGSGWKPAVTLVQVVFEEPEYAGPTRERLKVPWVAKAVAAGLRARLP